MATTYLDPIQTSDLPDVLRVIYSQELEFTAGPRLIFDQFTEAKSDFRVKRGERVYWTIFRNLPPAITALTENMDVDGGSMSDFQVSFTVTEYGYAIGTTEKIEHLSYFGPVSNIIKQVLGPQMALTVDLLARNALYGSGAKYKYYGGNATSRATITTSSGLTSDIIRQAGFHLSTRRVPTRGNGYVALVHPALIYDLSGTNDWINPNLYAGANRIFNGEVGMLRGIRFIESDNARLPNAGSVIVETTLNDATCSAGDTTIVVANASGFAAGQEVTIYPSTMSAPDGTNGLEEHVVILSVNSNTITLNTALLLAHANGSKVREAVDVFPVVFLGGLDVMGKGVVVEPEIRVALPTDKLRRMNFIGWYALLGYGIIRDWGYDLWEIGATQASAPAFPW